MSLKKIDDRYQFQWWALSLIRARPIGGQEGSREGKKGSDKGIDGIIAFIDDASNKAKRVLVQIESGHIKSGDIRDLVGTIHRKQAAIGVFLTLEKPSRDMVTEALKAGFYHSPGWQKDLSETPDPDNRGVASRCRDKDAAAVWYF